MMMLRVNPHMNDVHWWIYLDSLIIHSTIVFINLYIIYYAIKKSSLDFENIFLLLVSSSVGFMFFKIEVDEITFWPFLWSLFLNVIIFMKIKYSESRM